MEKRDIEQVKAYFEETDKLVEEADKGVAYVNEFLSKFEEINHTVSELEKRYFNGEWMANLQKLRAAIPDENYWSTGEDTIWNLHAEYYAQLLRMLKIISDKLYDSHIKP